MKTHIGSISRGTMRPEDLIPTFLDELSALSARKFMAGKPEDELKEFTETQRFIGAVDYAASFDAYYDEGEEAAEDLESLFDRLNEFAPPYCYFGAHPGDGSDCGFWVCENWREQAEEDDVPVLDGGDKLPQGFTGRWFFVSDHGNLTLYDQDEAGVSREVWAIV